MLRRGEVSRSVAQGGAKGATRAAEAKLTRAVQMSTAHVGCQTTSIVVLLLVAE